MIIVCISDTHGAHRQVDLPPGDLLVHAGDITAHGSREDYLDFLDWFGSRPHAHRLFVAGNHDTWLEDDPEEASRLARGAGVQWLNDSGTCIDGLAVWGSPITPRFHDWSFMRDPGEPIERHWNRIPAGTDLLITHGPSFGVLDLVERGPGDSEHTGCPSLLHTVRCIAPQAHVFGHIHEGHGERQVDAVRCLNVSTMDRDYRIANAPVTFELGASARSGRSTTPPLHDPA